MIGPVIYGVGQIDNRTEGLAVFAFVDAAVQALGLTLFLSGLLRGGDDDAPPPETAHLRVFPWASANGACIVLAQEL